MILFYKRLSEEKKLRSRQYLNLGPPAPFDQRWASLEKSNDNNDMVKNNSKYKALTN